jgi:hypothetical protein
MNIHNVRWVMALAGAIFAETVLVAAAFAWVAIYSHLVNPGQSLAFYQEYAKGSSPYVSLLLGMPVFFTTCRWVGLRAQAAPWAAAMALFGIYCAIELPIMLTVDNPALTPWFAAVNLPAKFLSCHLAARSAMNTGAAKAA